MMKAITSAALWIGAGAAPGSITTCLRGDMPSLGISECHRSEEPDLAALAAMSPRTGAMVVVGVIEHAGARLFCTAVLLHPKRGLVARHRKLMPIGS